VKERLLKLVKYAPLVGYPLFYMTCLCVFAVLTFPYDKLKQRVVSGFNAQPRPGNVQEELQIDEMSGYWLSGVRVKGVRWMTASGEAGKPASKIVVEEATVRYAILSALVGNTDVSFDVLAFGGEAMGSYQAHGKDRAVDVKLDAVDLGEIDPLVQMVGVPLQGKLGGTVKLTLPEGKASKATGSVSLEAGGVTVGDGKAKIKGAFALPKVDVGTLTLAADVKDGSLKISKLLAGGKDLELQGDGRVTLRETTTDSLFDGQIRFKVNDAYRSKSDATKGLFGTPGSTAPGAIDFDPKVKQSKRADGFYAWTLRGPIGRLEFIPAGGTGIAGSGITPAPLPGLSPPRGTP
jgi:type II secretion system protein N